MTFLKSNFLTFIIGCILTSCNTQPERNHSEGQKETNLRIHTLVSDSVWYDTYRGIHNRITRPMLVDALLKASDTFGIAPPDLGLLFFAASNLDSRGFDEANFKKRYPFANDSAVNTKFKSLQELGLLEYDEAFQISQFGRSIMDYLVKQIDDVEIPVVNESEFRLLIDGFTMIKHEAVKIDEEGRYPSLQERSNALVQPSKDVPRKLKLILLMDDLVAIRNDASHYRFKYLNNVEGDSLTLEAIEIMASAYSEPFSVSTFSSRPTWGHSGAQTRQFMAELQQFGLAKMEHDLLTLTQEGMDLQFASMKETELAFYLPWMVLDSADVSSLKGIIHKTLND
ncbi:MAG: hypothetical protein Tsb0034_20100 [Ekhidna sp.]